MCASSVLFLVTTDCYSILQAMPCMNFFQHFKSLKRQVHSKATRARWKANMAAGTTAILGEIQAGFRLSKLDSLLRKGILQNFWVPSGQGCFKLFGDSNQSSASPRTAMKTSGCQKMPNFLYTSCQARLLDRVVTSKTNTVYSNCGIKHRFL